MAQMMDLERLFKTGKEAFALLSEHDRPRKGKQITTPVRRSPSISRPESCNYQYPTTKPLVYQVNPETATQEEVILSSYDTVMKHDDLLAVDYSKKKSTAMAY